MQYKTNIVHLIVHKNYQLILLNVITFVVIFEYHDVYTVLLCFPIGHRETFTKLSGVFSLQAYSTTVLYDHVLLKLLLPFIFTPRCCLLFFPQPILFCIEGASIFSFFSYSFNRCSLRDSSQQFNWTQAYPHTGTVSVSPLYIRTNQIWGRIRVWSHAVITRKITTSRCNTV